MIERYGIRHYGKLIEQKFSRYVDAFNYRAAQNLQGAVIIEL